jgi:hypothetical protein
LTWTKDAAKLTLFIDRSLKGLASYKAVGSFLFGTCLLDFAVNTA